MIRVLVVDDHPVVREGLVAILEDEQDFQVVGAVGSAEDALALAPTARPDVILLDLELPGMNGVDAIPRFAATVPEARVIVLTAYDTDERVLGAIKAEHERTSSKAPPPRRLRGQSGRSTPAARTSRRVSRPRSSRRFVPPGPVR